MSTDPPPTCARPFAALPLLSSLALLLPLACHGREHAPSLSPATSPEASARDASAVDAGDAGDGSARRAPCPADMVLAAGAYCPNPVHVCLRWMDPPSSPYHDYRCAEYKEPATCSDARVQERFCIDREEYQRPGDTLPLAHQSWTSAGAVCAAQGKRLCKESEWQFACEGEEMRPYPYGWKRGDSTLCNIDRMDLGKPNAGLRDNRAPLSAHPQCLSPFGVHDMSGNVEEWVTQDQGVAPQRSSMKGAWWLPGKNTCRARTIGHGEVYEGAQVGVRCCAEAETTADP